MKKVQKAEEYHEMTNEEYIIEIYNIARSIKNNRILRRLCIYAHRTADEESAEGEVFDV